MAFQVFASAFLLKVGTMNALASGVSSLLVDLLPCPGFIRLYKWGCECLISQQQAKPQRSLTVIVSIKPPFLSGLFGCPFKSQARYNLLEGMPRPRCRGGYTSSFEL